MGHLQALDFVVILMYASGVLLIGWWASRKQVSTEEYFVGGRTIHPMVAGISIIATLVSSISYLAAPGEMIKNGPGWMWQMLHAPISFVVIGYFVIPHIMKHNVTSAYALLEHRFGASVRQTASILFILSRVFWMGLVIFTCSFAVATVSGLPIQGVLVAVGLLGTFYTVIGGLRAVLFTDLVQFVVLIGGAITTVVVVAVKCGGPMAWWPDLSSPALADLNWPVPEVFSLDPEVRLSIVSVIIYGCSYWIMTATGDQVVIQRFLSTRDAKRARRSFGISMIGDACTSLVLFCAGMALVAFFLQFPGELPDRTLGLTAQADGLFPHFIAAILPAGLTGLVVAALFAAAMSSLDSGISSISTVLVTDFPRVFTRGCANDGQVLSRARLVGFFVGCVGVAMSFGVSLVPGNNLLEVTVRVSSLLAAPIFVAFALVFFSRGSTPAGAWAGMTVGAVLSLGMTFWERIYFLLTGAAGSISFTFIMPLSALCAFVAGVVVSRFTRPRVAEEVL